ncbi:PTS sugar transporter subunit IIA [Zophobihabitans entericus]|uniref:PTS sugar transporter subunit IIA n=1 Tax=Zophobihabitans entericus TaxID=1635327 RepID=A0A6G9IBG0_9GAMM|nr:PTS sugar transporter subunit IIA [Zophobihabitans entericus]QIQ21568.1 PTS sugar transporter subunit IIA [Zophobihabitans entericus]
MATELPIILASHGSFAKGALSCAELLMGKQDNVATLSVENDSNIDQLREEFAELYEKMNNDKGLLVLVDIIGGTPCNLASELAIKHKNITIYTGFNIPILLEVLSNRDICYNEICPIINEVYGQSCVNATAILAITNDDVTEL